MGSRSRIEDTHADSLLHCDQCVPLSINGYPCHETGCPDAWLVPDGSGRAFERECDECGSNFEPEDREQTFCDQSCASAYFGYGWQDEETEPSWEQ